MEKVIRVGKMPGRITEVVVGETATIQEVLELAGLEHNGFDIKADGQVAQLTDKVGDANLVILAQQVKGNSEKTVRIGKMPGRIQEFVISPDATVGDLIELAGLDASGFDVKADGNIANLNDKIGGSELVILAQQVKGNK